LIIPKKRGVGFQIGQCGLPRLLTSRVLASATNMGKGCNRVQVSDPYDGSRIRWCVATRSSGAQLSWTPRKHKGKRGSNRHADFHSSRGTRGVAEVTRVSTRNERHSIQGAARLAVQLRILWSCLVCVVARGCARWPRDTCHQFLGNRVWRWLFCRPGTQNGPPVH
jgi:hypothetical protein